MSACFKMMRVYEVEFECGVTLMTRRIPAATLDDALRTFRAVYPRRGHTTVKRVVETETKVHVL